MTLHRIVDRVHAIFSPAALRNPVDLPGVYPVLFFTILANIPYWFASQMLALRLWGWFCVHYLTAGLLALLLPAWAAAALFALVVMADLLSAVCATYTLSLGDCLQNVGNFAALSLSRQLAMLLVALLLVLAVAIVYKMNLRALERRLRWQLAGVLAIVLVVLLVVDVRSIRRSSGATPNLFSMHAQSDGVNFSSLPDQSRMLRIPVTRLVRLAIDEAHVRLSMQSGMARPAASAAALGLKAANIDQIHATASLPNVVLVLVESWGHTEAAAMEDALVGRYQQQQLKQHYRVLRGTMAFHGTTVAGEARELCGREFGYALIDEPAEQLKGCLPERLEKLGYHSMAMHGLGGAMFRREHWYPTIGFDETLFHDDFAARGLPDCVGAFTGTCDTAIAGWLGDQLERQRSAPLFVHWVTLNQHLPLPVPVPGASPEACSPALGLVPGTPLCSWYQLQAAVHGSIAATAERSTSQPTVFIVVGDHVPPFVDEQSRARFSEDEVPYVLLIPRQLDRPSDRSLVHVNAPERPARPIRQRLTP